MNLTFSITFCIVSLFSAAYLVDSLYPLVPKTKDVDCPMSSFLSKAWMRPKVAFNNQNSQDNDN